ncbi:hypothetical protein HDU93_008358 [Gonapodya sp. JEL0774]|nr:hypothetical protein HDU93_008358 [Gonapodya sp. JEL0774]
MAQNTSDTKDVLSFLDSLDTLTGSSPGAGTAGNAGIVGAARTAASSTNAGDTADVLSFLDEISSIAAGASSSPPGASAPSVAAPQVTQARVSPSATPPRPSQGQLGSPSPAADTRDPLPNVTPAPSKGHAHRPSATAIPTIPVEPIRQDDAVTTAADIPPPPKAGFVPTQHQPAAARDHPHHSKRVILTAPEVLSPTLDKPAMQFPVPGPPPRQPVLKLPEAKPELTTITASTPDLSQASSTDAQSSQQSESSTLASLTSFTPPSWSSWSTTVLTTGAKWVATARTQAERAAKEIVEKVQEEIAANDSAAREVGAQSSSASSPSEKSGAGTHVTGTNLPSLLRSEWREVQHFGASILDTIQTRPAPLSSPNAAAPPPIPPTPTLYLSFPPTVSSSLARHLPAMIDYVSTEILGKRAREARRAATGSVAAAAAVGTGKTIGLLLGLTTGAEDEDEEDGEGIEQGDKPKKAESGITEWVQDVPVVNVVGLTLEDGVWERKEIATGLDEAVSLLESALQVILGRYAPLQPPSSTPLVLPAHQPTPMPNPSSFPAVPADPNTPSLSPTRTHELSSFPTVFILLVLPFHLAVSSVADSSISSKGTPHLGHLVLLHSAKVPTPNSDAPAPASRVETRAVAQTVPTQAVGGYGGEREKAWIEEAEVRSVEGAVVGVIEEWMGACGGW